jgi:hypothetical protein
MFIGTSVYSQYPNRQVTNNPYDQSETAIAVDPINNMNIISVWNDYRIDTNQAYRAGYGISTDGGSTWLEGILDISSLLPEYKYGANPSVAFDRYGNVFYCYVACDGTEDGQAIVVVKSSDLGAT